MKAFLRPIAILLTAILFVQAARSQTPVQVTPQLLPPYSLQASEYYSGIQPKLQVLLLNRDISQPTIQVKLRLTIESQNCRMQTKLNAITPTFTLTSGIPYYMSPSELQAFFTASNIDFGGGYTEQQYLQTGRLPEGLYSFYIEAFELNTGNLVSNKGFTLGWLTLADPPMLNTPSRAEGVSPTNPQNIVFNWTPRHNTSPTAGYLTDYIFSIAEYNDINIGPEASFSSSPPLFIDSVQTTTYLFGAGQPQLVPGKRYAWRVQAKAKNGTVPLAMFRNNGYSEVYWFTYQNNCAAPVGIGHTVQGVRATIEWTNNPQHMEWRVEYREKNNPDAQWFSINNTIPRVMLTDLRPATQYEYRVGGSCIAGQFTYSTLFSFTTAGSPVSPVANCGDSVLVSAGGGQLLQNLNAGDTLRAGTFTVNVGYSTGVGSFTGMGFVKVPWLMNAKVEVRFTNITLSLDRKLISGVIETTYDPTESGIGDIDEYIDFFTGGTDVGSVINGADTTAYNVNFNIPNPCTACSFTPNGSGGGTINFGNGQTLVVTSLPTTIRDLSGNIYQVNSNGQVTLIGNSGGQSLIVALDKSKVDLDKGRVDFEAAPGMTYAFDSWNDIYLNSNSWGKKYEKIGEYRVAAKAIAPGKPDFIHAKLTLTDPQLKADSIVFVNGKGTIYKKELVSANIYKITLTGGPGSDAQEIYAIHKNGSNKPYNLGKLLVASYTEQVRKVILVPVNGAQVNENAIKQKLEEVYGKICIKWEVIKLGNFSDFSWDLNGDSLLNVQGSGLFSTLTAEMKALNNAYKSKKNIEAKAQYLFVLKGASNNTSGMIAGDMPRKKQFGYLFTNNGTTNIEKAAAHEIGHGALTLKHTFDGYGFEKNDLEQTNLMDYGTGEGLSKFQWDMIHDPGVVLGLFESDKDGELVVNDMKIFDRFKNSQGYTFMSPGGKPITLPPNTESVRLGEISAFQAANPNELLKVPQGALTNFTLNGINYNAWCDVGYIDFLYYKGKDANEVEKIYKDELTKALTETEKSSKKVITAYPCINIDPVSQNVTVFIYGQEFVLTNSSWNDINNNEYKGAGTFANAIYESEYKNFNKKDVSGKFLIAQTKNTYSEIWDNKEVQDYMSKNITCALGLNQFVLQTANLIVKYPGAYTTLKECQGMQVPTFDASKPESTFWQYKNDCRTFLQNLTAVADNQVNIEASIMAENNHSALSDILAHLCGESAYKNFKTETRKHILQVLTNQTFITGCYAQPGKNCEEKQLIYTVSTTIEGEQSKEIYDFLRANCYIMRRLLNDVDDDNNAELMQTALCDLYTKATGNPAIWIPDYVNGKTFRYDAEFEQEGNKYRINITPNGPFYDPVNTSTCNNNNMIRIEEFVQRIAGSNNAAHYPNYQGNGFQWYNFNAFDEIAVEFASSFKIDGEEIFPAKSIVKMPALLFWYVINKRNNVEAMKRVRVTVKTLAFVAGAWELAAARTIGGVIFATTDILAVGSDLYLNEAGAAQRIINKITDPVDKQRAQEVLSGYTTLIQIYGVFRAGQGAYSLGKSLSNYILKHRSDITRMNNLLADDFASGSAEGQLLKKLDDLAGPAGNFVSRLDDFPAVKTKFNNFTPDEQAAFLQDFSAAEDDVLAGLNADNGKLVNRWKDLSQTVSAANRIDVSYLKDIDNLNAEVKFYPHIEGEITPTQVGLNNPLKGGRGGHDLQSFTTSKIRYSQLDPQARNPVDIATTTNANWYNTATGVRKAYIDVYDPVANIWKFKETNYSTFFPPWSKQRIIEEIASAMKDARIKGTFGGVSGQVNMWEGVSTSGIIMRGYKSTSQAGIATAWPEL